MASATAFFSLFYAVFTLGFLARFREFSGAGITPENVISHWLTGPNSEEVRFVQHHIVRSAGTVLVHAFLPAGYVLGYAYMSDAPLDVLVAESAFFGAGLVGAVALVVGAATLVFYWSLDGWACHPHARKVANFSVNNVWAPAAAINAEFRSIDKLVVQSSPISKVVVTDNWIIHVGQWPWSYHIAHQGDVDLEVKEGDLHQLSSDGQAGGVQFLKILVKSRRSNVGNFHIRLNSMEYRNLEDRVRSTISNVGNVAIFKSVADRFVEVFRTTVERNPRIAVGEVDHCVGCMNVPAEVKLERRCGTENDALNPCVTCFCRPMWCLTCMGKWFAMKQDQERPDTWLGSKCPCPTCRSKFCILDVSLIDNL